MLGGEWKEKVSFVRRARHPPSRLLQRLTRKEGDLAKGEEDGAEDREGSACDQAGGGPGRDRISTCTLTSCFTLRNPVRGGSPRATRPVLVESNRREEHQKTPGAAPCRVAVALPRRRRRRERRAAPSTASGARGGECSPYPEAVQPLRLCQPEALERGRVVLDHRARRLRRLAPAQRVPARASRVSLFAFRGTRVPSGRSGKRGTHHAPWIVFILCRDEGFESFLCAARGSEGSGGAG